MKTKYIYFAVAAIAIAAVLYPVAYTAITNNAQLNDPYICTPFIPCQGPNPGFELCTRSCTIYMTNSTFSPGTVNATVGSKITWVNLDSFSHTSTSFNSSGWDTGFIPPGHSVTVEIGKNMSDGAYYYHCNIHPQMVGLVNVV